MITPKCYSYARFSTLEQSKGDSLRRQLQASEEWAKEHNQSLDNTLKDEGLSAYKGEHRSKGALGGFLSQVRAGKVPKGSVLLVESLDRLSREQITEALQQFLDIIRADIMIVTLLDKMEYTQETINNNIGQLMMSLVIMIRANEESQTKAKRLKEAWIQKRNMIEQKKMTARAPAWLRLSKDKKSFIPIPERVEIINWIYRVKLQGKGSESIAVELNQQSKWLPDERRKNTHCPPGWHKSYINKILRSRAVIGEFQPYKVNEKGIRVPVEKPIMEYYPRVIPLELFHAVQAKLELNKEKAGNGGGRNGKISNLFGHIAKCGYCGAPMAFVNKGQTSKGGQYLVCDNARLGKSCKRRPISYNEFEELVLTYCRNLNPLDILPGHEERETAIRSLRMKLSVELNKEKELRRKISNLSSSIADKDDSAARKTLEELLAQLLAEKDQIEIEIQGLDRKVKQLSEVQLETEIRLKSMCELFAFMRENSGEKLIDLRRRLRDELRGLIDKIEVFPVGKPLYSEDSIDKMLKAVLDVDPDADKVELEKIEKDLRNRIENKEYRQYSIHFKGGSWRVVKPNTTYKLAIDYNREIGKLLNAYEGINGEIITFEFQGGLRKGEV